MQHSLLPSDWSVVIPHPLGLVVALKQHPCLIQQQVVPRWLHPRLIFWQSKAEYWQQQALNRYRPEGSAAAISFLGSSFSFDMIVVFCLLRLFGFKRLYDVYCVFLRLHCTCCRVKMWWNFKKLRSARRRIVLYFCSVARLFWERKQRFFIFQKVGLPM